MKAHYLKDLFLWHIALPYDLYGFIADKLYDGGGFALKLCPSHIKVYFISKVIHSFLYIPCGGHAFRVCTGCYQRSAELFHKLCYEGALDWNPQCKAFSPPSQVGGYGGPLLEDNR
jgi:hypothetical protein